MNGDTKDGESLARCEISTRRALVSVLGSHLIHAVISDASLSNASGEPSTLTLNSKSQNVGSSTMSTKTLETVMVFLFTASRKMRH